MIGTAKKINFTDITTISPGSKYKITTLFDNNKSKQKGYSLGLTREVQTINMQKIAINSYINPHKLKIPGVGRYHLETSVSKKKYPAYTLRERTKMTDRTMTIEPQNNNPSPAAYENNPEKSSSLFSSSFKRLSYSGSRSKRFLDPGIHNLKQITKYQDQPTITTIHPYRTWADTWCPRREEEPGPNLTMPNEWPSSTRPKGRQRHCQDPVPTGSRQNLDNTMETSIRIVLLADCYDDV